MDLNARGIRNLLKINAFFYFLRTATQILYLFKKHIHARTIIIDIISRVMYFFWPNFSTLSKGNVCLLKWTLPSSGHRPHGQIVLCKSNQITFYLSHTHG
jgi:hypothetical protein